MDIYQGSLSPLPFAYRRDEKADLFWCNDLVQLWYEAETGDPEQAVKKISLWLEQHSELRPGAQILFGRCLPSIGDWRTLGSVLHYYVVSLLNQWSENTLAQVG